MDKNEEKEHLEEHKACEGCGSVYLLSRLYKVSCWDRWDLCLNLGFASIVSKNCGN